MPPTESATFAARLLSLRQKKGWTQAELALRSEVSQPMLSLLENGDRQPSLEVAGKLADALGVKMDALRHK